MKKLTKYFISEFVSSGGIPAAIQSAENLRNDFLKAAANLVSEIESESIQIVYSGPHNNTLAALISLTYYSNK